MSLRLRVERKAMEQTAGSMSNGKSIRLFLVDGTPQGLITAQMANWSGQILAAPRQRIGGLLNRPEVSRTGIYILVGADPDRAGGLLAYVGEADDVAARLRHHVRTPAKDFFERVAVVVCAANSLTKGHVRYVEAQLIKLIQRSGATLANDTAPDFQRLPEADRADMDHFVANAVGVLPLVGFDLFRRSVSSVGADHQAEAAELFVFSTGGATAQARETDDGFIVVAGSTAKGTASDTFPKGYVVLRDQLLRDGSLVADERGELYRFITDVRFSSPSAAASIVAARNASGPIEWKVAETGQTYREWREVQLAPQ